MGRTLGLLLAALLVLASPASAKGPHVLLLENPEPAEAGKPWVATIEFREYERVVDPVLVAKRGERSEVARSRVRGGRHLFRLVLPAEGRWRLDLLERRRHFELPALEVGSGEVLSDYAAFARGTEGYRQTGGGVFLQMDPEPVEAADDGVRPPEVIRVAAQEDDAPREGGIPLWIPAAALLLAGLGLALPHSRERLRNALADRGD
jgi:hypothetical protein